MTRLTEEMVIARSRQSDLGSIKKLNCWGSDLSDVSIVRRMRGVEVLALSVNKIGSLQDFEDCRNLQELYLRKNNIQDLNEIAYLQSLPNLKYLWLEENPCCDKAGPHYRSIVLRALPNLKKLDNIEVTPEEIQEALRATVQRDEPPEVYEDAREQQQVSSTSQQQAQQQQYHQQQQQQREQQYQQQQQQQRRSQSPIRENPQQPSSENTEECISDPINQASIPSSPLQRTPPSQDFSPPEQMHPPSPKYSRDHRMSYHQYDRSPGSDQESPIGGGCRERGPIPPSISSHSMKEYYQSDYHQKTHPSHYRHSQTDLSEWDDHHSQYNGGGGGGGHHPQRRSAGTEREMAERYGYRNGSGRDKDDWEDDRPRRERSYHPDNNNLRRRSEVNPNEINPKKEHEKRRPDGRFSDTASVVSNAVLNHYAGYHRRPVNRSSNLLSATLCLVKELDYPSLEVVEHAVRCRIDELSAD